MEIIKKLKKYFITSKSWVIDLQDCTIIPSGKTIVDTIQNWAINNKKEISFLSTMNPVTFILNGTKYVANITRERGAYTLHITNCE
ncbi:DUF4318 domain-containing protein [Candidatus Clostridium stratigraminis]|uniref:DUF4318 domain-containing protein n=1 Tax=Candidatus Clostridium stratigraminis TaxID=3381661 RepID=A0ABW8T7W7_9CLOT